MKKNKKSLCESLRRILKFYRTQAPRPLIEGDFEITVKRIAEEVGVNKVREWLDGYTDSLIEEITTSADTLG